MLARWVAIAMFRMAAIGFALLAIGFALFFFCVCVGRPAYNTMCNKNLQ